jgi:hypothetical protein
MIGAAESMCMRDEPNWRGKPNYAIRSMAQTRAGGKAIRSVFAWVAVLAGYSGTPAEEMDESFSHKPTTSKAPSKPPQKAPQAKKASDGSITLCPENVGQKEGKGAKGPWTRTYFKHGENWFSTFNTDMGSMLLEASESGRQVEISYSAGEKGMDIETVTFIDEPTQQQEPVEDVAEMAF